MNKTNQPLFGGQLSRMLSKQHQQIAVLNQNYRNPLALMTTAYILLDAFLENKDLRSLKIVSVIRVKDETLSGTLRLDHFIKLESEGEHSVYPLDPVSQSAWIGDNLPIEYFGNGAIKLNLTDQLVIDYLTAMDTLERESIAFRLCQLLLKEITPPVITHHINPYR